MVSEIILIYKKETNKQTVYQIVLTNWWEIYKKPTYVYTYAHLLHNEYFIRNTYVRIRA